MKIVPQRDTKAWLLWADCQRADLHLPEERGWPRGIPRWQQRFRAYVLIAATFGFLGLWAAQAYR